MTSAPLSSGPLYRIGAVSKATGIPVSTLRVWESRYGAFQPVKTEGKQRLYEEQDVAKAMLLKQLCQDGHAISAIANLAPAQLRRMRHAPNTTHTPSASTPQTVKLVVVGMGLANRIESQKIASNLERNTLQVTDVFADLASLSQAKLSDTAHVLLVKVNSLHTSVHTSLQVIMREHKFAQTIVVYNFAPEAVVQAMRFSGITVRREPISDSELAELLLSVLFIDATRAQAFGTSGAVIPSRKFSDATLSRVAGISTNVLCECPRHVAELLSQLASFEEYSQTCLNQNADDAHLHAYLRAISGSARALFENALEKIAQHEGIDLRDIPLPIATP